MTELVHLIVIIFALCALGYLLEYACRNAPFPQPVRFALWALLVVIALIVLLPFLGISGLAH